MDDAIQTFISSLLAPATLAAILAFLVVLWRTRSIHALVMRCWSLMSGNFELVDGEIRSYGKELHNLSYFQVLTGLRIRSLDEADRLIAWARQRRIDLRDAAWCAGYFDQKNLRVRVEAIPGSRVRISLVMFVMTWFLISLAVFLFFSSSSKAYFQFKESQSSFYLSHQEARRWYPLSFFAGSEDLPLNVAVCREIIADKYLEEAGFTRPESFDLCAVLTAEDAKLQIDTMLRKQKKDAMGLFAMLMVFLVLPGIELRRIVYARNLAERLSQPDGGISYRAEGWRNLRRSSIAKRRKFLLQSGRR
ncbi:DUF6216 family protein [Pseudomonas sp. CGJS7]|uniref:DUF6216 family protein n=1 Tax=Pseudomonas sp. CGJS7 TaxID=3109348 RepID=UPI003008BAD9